MRADRVRTALRPPMGWNSWDCFGASVTEAEVLANAEYLAEHLLPHGWDTVVVDIQWYEPNPGMSDYQEVSEPVLDAWGRPQPAVGRFPSAAEGGFTALAARVHALGLRFGVHLMRGVPRRAVEERLPILGSDATCADIADRGNVCPWNPDNYGVDMSAPGAQEYYDLCWRSWPPGASTSSSSTTCSTRRSRPTRSPRSRARSTPPGGR